MKLYLRALFAILPGIALCFTDAKIRRLALRPWIIGAVCYVVSMVGAWNEHARLVAVFSNQPEGVLSWIYFSLVWLAAAILLLGVALVVSVIIVQIFTSSFQSAIAAQVLRERGVHFPEDAESGVGATVKEGIRVTTVELGKLLFLVPCIAVVFLIGFFPLLLPLAVLGTAWLLAYQFADIVLDLYKLSVRERFRLCVREKIFLVCFGLGLTVLWVIPFAGIFLAPAAAAGCARLLSDSPLLAEAQRVSAERPRIHT